MEQALLLWASSIAYLFSHVYMLRITATAQSTSLGVLFLHTVINSLGLFHSLSPMKEELAA